MEAREDESIPLWAWLMMLAALGLLLRASMPGVIQYGIDEGIASSLATQIANGRDLPLAGIRTSYGFLNPPTYIYLLAPFFALTRDPALVALFPMFLGALAVVFAGLAGETLGCRRTALIVALIMAVCPNAIEHSRRLWGHDLQVFLASVALCGALRAHHRWWLFASFAAAAVAQTCHLSGILLWLPGLVAVACSPRRRLLPLTGGVIVLAALYVPWLIHQTRTDWADLRIILGALTGGAASADLAHPVPPWAAWAFVLGDAWNNDLLGARRPWDIAPVASVLLSILSLILCLGALVTGALGLHRREHRLLILTLPFLATPLLFGGLMGAVVPPYLLPALVPAALLAAHGISRLCDGRWRIPAGITLALYIVSALVYTAQTRLALASGEGTSVSLDEKKTIVRTIDELSDGKPFRLMQGTRAPSTGIDVAYIYLFHWRGISDRYTTRTPQTLFVLTPQNREGLPPEAAALLEPYAIGHTDHLTLHQLPEHAQNSWLQALKELHP